MTELDLMRFLYDCGYWRATIQSVETLKTRLYRVKFLNVQVQQAALPIHSRTKPVWPASSHLVRARGPFFTPATHIVDDDCVVGFGMPLHDLMHLFKSTEGMLCRDPTGYAFPDVTMAALKMSASTCIDDYDRIIVYTDGSSKARDRHRPPAWNDESGHGDSWAFVVLGETLTAAAHKVEVLGWTTQPVIYDQSSDHFIGADGVGSYLAEREALAWAALWRLAQNSRVDTLFRSDSLTSAQQAMGLMGCSAALRGQYLSMSFVAYFRLWKQLYPKGLWKLSTSTAIQGNHSTRWPIGSRAPTERRAFIVHDKIWLCKNGFPSFRIYGLCSASLMDCHLFAPQGCMHLCLSCRHQRRPSLSCRLHFQPQEHATSI